MSPIRLLTTLPGVWKTVGVIVTLFLTGLGVGLAAAGWQHLPARVSALELSTDSIHNEHQQVRDEIRRVRVLIQQQLCLSVAEKERTPWQRCIDQ